MSSDSLLASDVAISVRSLSKEYRVFGRPHQRILESLSRRMDWDREFGLSVQAVDDVSFDLERGTSVAIIGRNGSGKSTLLEMITGTLAPTGGEVRLQGRVSALLELGAGFNPDFSGRENYRLNASILGLTDRQIQEMEPAVEEFAELGSFMDEPVRTYSSGMYVRLAFAAAVHVEPEVLIIDEALAVGDVFFQQKCFDFLESELAHVTKLLVTHDLAMAAKLADRCLVMDHGKLVYDGDSIGGIQTFTALSLGQRSAAIQAAVDAGDSERREDDSDEGEDAAGVEVGTKGASSPDLFRVESIAAELTDPVTGGRQALSTSPWPCVHGHELRLRLSIVVGVKVDDPVLGYLVRDRVGNVVFGENSIGSNIEIESLTPGSFSVEMVFEWPEVAPGEYTLTVGLGDGLHSHFHQIVGWVQGVASMASITERSIHGLFNNELTSLVVKAR